MKLATLVAAASLCTVKARVALLPNYTWSNLAWGFPDGGIDTTAGAKVITVDPDFVKATAVAGYKAGGQIVSCYLSGGSLETWRPYYALNKAAWNALVVAQMDGWNEQWLDIRQLSTLVKLETQRMSGLKMLGCDVVETDNLDCYDNDACWGNMAGSSQAQIRSAQVAYVSAIADAAHSLGMSVTFKNAVDIVPLVAAKFDGAVVEACVKYKECANFNKYFVKKNKAVFAVEYRSSTTCSMVPVGFTLKYCASTDGSVCSSTKWTNCLAPANPLPPTVSARLR